LDFGMEIPAGKKTPCKNTQEFRQIGVLRPGHARISSGRGLFLGPDDFPIFSPDMKRLIFPLLSAMAILNSCQQAPQGPAPLYESAAFTLLPDAVRQGNYEAKALSATHLSSNYQSLEHEQYSRLLIFKFSLNEKDNEAAPGIDHRVAVGDADRESPVFVFGEAGGEAPQDPGTPLPPNHGYTFRVDLRPVLRQFEEKGYYEAYDGSRIAKADFKGVYIAGGALPLTWDFVNLGNKGLQLQDPDGDGIYAITLTLNPYHPDEHREKSWQPSQDLSAKPRYTSGQPLVDALFNLSLDEALQAIEPDSTLRTGAKWGGVWTRDVSYSILLAFAYHEPEVAKISLMRKVNRDRIVQDTGSGGAWPVSSDRTTWALAAWEVYLATGDEDWLRQSFRILKNTLEDDRRTLLSPSTGMYRGESSFLDWREQTYPKWMSNMDIYVSENLGTNAVHYRAHRILAAMAERLGEPHEEYLARAAMIKDGINRHLWMPDKGYYAQYLYGRQHLMKSPRFEALGEALAVLFDVASPEQAASILSKSPVTPFGTTCIYPQIPGIPPYHNNGIWPFVQSYWNLAAAKAGNEAALLHGLAAIYRAGGLFLTNYENFVAENGDYMGTEINSHRMLWSMAGNLAMVHRVFMGMSLEPDGIRFSPVVPKPYGGTRRLEHFRYRQAVLDIEVKGHGNRVASFRLDGKESEPFFPASLSGAHRIEIQLEGNEMGGSISLVPNAFTLPNPQARLEGRKLVWEPVEGASSYQIYRNGQPSAQVQGTAYELPSEQLAQYAVAAVDARGVQSFCSEPLYYGMGQRARLVQAEDFAPKAPHPYVNFEGKGFVELSNGLNRRVALRFEVAKAGRYLLDFRYSNGTGPWNTDNNCGIRSLYVNGEYAGVAVFPQRGTDEWSDWGFSNAFVAVLPEGESELALVLEEWNTNMDVDINTAMLDCLRVLPLEGE
jgi:hypothetical protein